MFESLFLSAIALLFIFEGLLPFAFPNFWKKIMTQALAMSEKQLRTMGMVSILIGLLLLTIFS